MPELWYEITAKTPSPLVEAVTAVLREIAPGGVSVQEPIDILGPEEGYRVRQGEPVDVSVYLPVSELGAVLVDNLRQALHAFEGVEIIAKPLMQQDWSVSWREFFGVVDTGGKLVIVPSWVEHDLEPGQLAIRLDPGQAFGTGHHETTRLCLRALETYVRTGADVLDVGSGSGILAIGAALLGAGKVTGLDIDPIAAEVANENITANGVESVVAVGAGVLDDTHHASYDLVLSNIHMEVNVRLAPHFGRVTRPGGHVLLSGILTEQAARVRAAMDAEGFALTEMGHERDWCLLAFRKPAG